MAIIYHFALFSLLLISNMHFKSLSFIKVFFLTLLSCLSWITDKETWIRRVCLVRPGPGCIFTIYIGDINCAS